MIITEYKPVGITCGQLIKKYKNKRIAYVGRLDPMAHGLINILTDDDVSLMEIYMRKNKTYKFKFIMSVNTDTDDILGIHSLDDKQKYIQLIDIINYINNFPDKYKQKYHIFSSYKPNKKNKDNKRKALWWWTVNGYTIDNIPERDVKIYKKKIVNIEKKTGIDIKYEFFDKLCRIEDDKFRKGETLKQWSEYEFDDFYDVFTCEFSVSSGFYIRQFVKDMSDKLKVKLIVIDIERTSIE
jgi:tRNA U55 pseudouridine synthase TruB